MPKSNLKNQKSNDYKSLLRKVDYYDKLTAQTFLELKKQSRELDSKINKKMEHAFLNAINKSEKTKKMNMIVNLLLVIVLLGVFTLFSLFYLAT